MLTKAIHHGARTPNKAHTAAGMKAKRQPVALIPGWTVEDVAQYLATTARGIYELIEQGRLPYRKLGGRYLFRPEHVEAFLAELPGMNVEEALKRCRDLGYMPARVGEANGNHPENRA
jgi:excisionase family DNA binding protein